MIDFHAVKPPAEFLEATDVSPAASVAFLEGPAASADGRVYFSDIANNRIMRFDANDGRCAVFRQPSGRANGLLFDP